MLRLLRSQTQTQAAIGSRQLARSISTAFCSTRRSLSIQKRLIHTGAIRCSQAMDEESALFAGTTQDIITFKDMREDSESMHYMTTGKTMAEQLSVMQACLLNGNIERAQRIFVGLHRLYPEAMRDVADASVHNEIINGLLDAKPRPLTSEALLWYDQMDRNYHVKPNTNTFAILIGGFVK